jgi:hypothetical protein
MVRYALGMSLRESFLLSLACNLSSVAFGIYAFGT